MKHSLLVIVLPLFAIACSSPVSRFPNFPVQKASLGKAALFADAVLINDSMRDTNLVDMLETRDIARSVLDSLRTGMSGKGYDVASAELASIGLVMKRREVFKVIEMESERELAFEELPSRIPPLYVSAQFLGDEERRKALTGVLKALVVLSPEDRSEHLVIQDANTLGKSLDVSAMMIVMMGGYNMPATKEYNEGAVSTIETVGPVGMRRVSQFTLEFYILDAASGELLWHDRAYHRGGTVNKEQALHFASDLISRLP
jgi:hypothetical protein